MRRGRVLICIVVFFVVAAVARAMIHGVFDALGIDYEPTGGSRSDPKNSVGQFIAAALSLAIPALATVLVYRWLDDVVDDPAPSTAGRPRVPSSTPPANWYPDPSGQYETRYWDGGRWTEHVSTGGVRAVSPVPEP